MIEAIVEFFGGLSTVYARPAAMLFFAGVLLLVWLLPRRYVYENADTVSWRSDLRIWATLLVVVQCGLYLIF